ncbi:MAG: DUF2652 domain-containing protein [Chloroflexi bacterium]|nr:DUF2652 domain-containing protein [Chloroflexota bacterium]
MSPSQPVGLLLIPDISGFTQFVSEVEISHSKHIVTDLLELLIDANKLGLKLCEVEGDALFYYKQGDIPAFAPLVDQIDHWSRSFHSRLRLLERDTYCKCGACQGLSNLGLKVVGHCGEFSAYAVKKQVKVMGEDVILVHRMLKNSVVGQDYALFSRSLTNRIGTDRARNAGFREHQETYETFGEISMDYLDLSGIAAEVPPAPPRRISRPSREFHAEVDIKATLNPVVKTVADLETWPSWFAGLSHIEMDRSAPVHVGHHHVCVFPGNPLSITLEEILAERDEFTLVNSIAPPPMLKRLMVTIHVQQREGNVTVRFTYHYAPKFWARRKFEKEVAPDMLERARQSLQNLKFLVEEGPNFT